MSNAATTRSRYFRILWPGQVLDVSRDQVIVVATRDTLFYIGCQELQMGSPVPRLVPVLYASCDRDDSGFDIGAVLEDLPERDVVVWHHTLRRPIAERVHCSVGLDSKAEVTRSIRAVHIEPAALL
jgi:hypothetical protein